MITYLASPYTTDDTNVLEQRVHYASVAAAELMELGHNVFAPVPHSHFISHHLDDDRRLDHEFWMRQDLAILERCGLLVVLCLDGWAHSKGVAREIEFAEDHDIPIIYLKPREPQ